MNPEGEGDLSGSFGFRLPSPTHITSFPSSAMLTWLCAAVNVGHGALAGVPIAGAAVCLGQVRNGVDRAAVEDRHEVQVRSGRETGHADVADGLPRRDRLAHLYRRRA